MDPIEEQLLAYNSGDLERFIAAYSPDIVIEDGEDHVLMKGLDQMRAQYGRLFESNPDLHCRLVSRIKTNNYTLDEEEVTGVKTAVGPLHAVAIYRVKADKIIHVRMLS